MAVTSFIFLCFVAITFLLYYLLPKKCQWVILLLASAAFYYYAMQSDPMWMLFIAAAAVISFFTAIWTGSYHKKQKAELADKKPDRAEKKAIKAKFQKKRRRALGVGVKSRSRRTVRRPIFSSRTSTTSPKRISSMRTS